MKTYRLKRPEQPVEALRWTDTAENRVLFAAWFDRHDWIFELRGHEVVLDPEAGVRVPQGAWVVYMDDGCDFVAMTDHVFQDKYVEVLSP